MKILKNELFDEFNCLAGDCPETCCYGWRIVVDEDTRKRILEKEGAPGFFLKRCLGGPDRNYFNYECNSCFFHDLHGLCGIQKKIGTEYMPEICRRYPREIRNYGTFGTKNLDLSCIEVSRMLLLRDRRPQLIWCDEPCERECHGSNEDPQFQEIVLDSQKQMIEMLQLPLIKMADAGALDVILHAMLSYAQFAQAACLSHEEMKLTQDGNGPMGFYETCLQGDIPDENRSYFPLPIMALNRMINTDFDREDARRFAKINRIISWYHLKFDLKTEIDGQKIWTGMVKDFFGEDPSRMEVMLRYLQYDIQQCYAEIYENYSFVHSVVLSIMHVNMLLFLSVNYARKKELTPDAQASIISAYERGACHNFRVQRDMYEIACDYLPIK